MKPVCVITGGGNGACGQVPDIHHVEAARHADGHFTVQDTAITAIATTATISPTFQSSINTTPSEVATPLPPLNPK